MGWDLMPLWGEKWVNITGNNLIKITHLKGIVANRRHNISEKQCNTFLVCKGF